MSDQKPREFWIKKDYYAKGILHPVDDLFGSPLDIHVIEKSAYDDLKKVVVDYELGTAYCYNCEIKGEIVELEFGKHRRCSKCGYEWMSAAQIAQADKQLIAKLRADLDLAIEALENAPSMDTETFENIGTPFRNDFDTWTAVTRELLAKLQGEKK